MDNTTMMILIVVLMYVMMTKSCGSTENFANSSRPYDCVRQRNANISRWRQIMNGSCKNYLRTNYNQIPRGFCKKSIGAFRVTRGYLINNCYN